LFLDNDDIYSRWKVNKETVADQIVNAINAGYRLFDCAQDYNNEKVNTLWRWTDIRNAEKVFVVQLKKD